MGVVMNDDRFGSVVARKNKNGETVSWRAKYHSPIDGSQVTRSFSSKSTAYAWLDDEHDLVRDHIKGRAAWVHPSQRERRKRGEDTLFREYAWDWYREHGRTRDGRPLAPATLRYKDLAMLRLDAAFGERALNSISRRDVDGWLASPGFEGRAPLRTAYLLLRSVMAAAQRDGSIDRNPCEAAVPAKPKSANRLIAPATRAQIARIEAAMPEYSRIAIRVALAFGLRAAEICALRVCDFDMDAMVLRLRHSVRRGEGDVGPARLGDMKTDSSRENMPIPSGLKPVLEEHIARFCDTADDAMLIRPMRSAVLSPNTLRAQFDRARAKAGRPDLHLHTLRATAISEAVHQGAEPAEAQRFGRHSDPRVSLQAYQRARGEERMRELSDDVYASLFGAPGHEGAEAELERKVREAKRLNEGVVYRLDCELPEGMEDEWLHFKVISNKYLLELGKA
jgi:integrase